MEGPDAQPSHHRWDRAVWLLPAALTAWVAMPFVRLDRWVTGFDTIAYSGPNLVVSVREIRRGRVPQWNPEIFGGVTHIGNAQAAVFEPLMWITSRLPFHRALMTIVAAHLAILALGMWCLLRRRLHHTRAAAALGTVAVIGSGAVMSRSIQFEQIAVVAWVPWVLVGCDMALAPGSTKRAVGLLALAGAALSVSGHPQQVYIALPLTVLWCVGRFLDHAPGWRGIARLLAGGALMLGLAGAQLLPSALALDDSAVVGQRDISEASSPLYSAQARRLPSTILGDVAQETHPFTSGSFEAMAFVGAVTGALVITGLLIGWRRGGRWTLAAMLLAMASGAVLSLGPRTAVYRFLHRTAPGFDLARVPGRWMLLLVIAAAIVAAMSLDQVSRDGIRRTPCLAAVGILCVTVATSWFGPFRRPSSAGLVWWGVAFALVTLVLLARAAWPARAGALPVLVVVAAALELGVMSNHSLARGLQAGSPFTELGSEITTYLQTQPGRTLALTDDRLGEPDYLVPGMRPNTNAALGIASLDGYDGGTQVTKRWVQAVAALSPGTLDPELPLRSQMKLPISTQVSARLGLRWLLVDTNGRPLDSVAPDWGPPARRDGTMVLLENPDWEAEATIVRRSTTAPADHPAPVLRSAPPGTVVLEMGSAALPSCALACETTRAATHRVNPTSIDIDLPSGTQAGMLTIDEQASEGWSARVDGSAVPIEEANGMYIGVRVPDGAERVELRYAAPGLRRGLVVSGASLVVALLILLAPATIWTRIASRRPRSV
ncbi:MAG: YfhO family protein [Actinomycetota bacterium]